jgi:hypothetical protein
MSATDSAESNDVKNFYRMDAPGLPPPDPIAVVSEFANLGRALKRNESFRKVAEQIARIAETAEQTVMQEAGDWFDSHTIKRNMKELKNYASQFAKISEELDMMQQRATALYDDMGNVLTRYFEMAGDSRGEDEEDDYQTAAARGAVGMGTQGQQGLSEAGSMTRNQAWEEFKREVLPHIKQQYEKDGVPDKPARREAWNNYIDMLERDGRITTKAAASWGHPARLEKEAKVDPKTLYDPLKDPDRKRVVTGKGKGLSEAERKRKHYKD